MLGDPEDREQDAADAVQGRSWSWLADREAAGTEVSGVADDEDHDDEGHDDEGHDDEGHDDEGPHGSDPGPERTSTWRRALRWPGRLLRPVGWLVGQLQRPLVGLNRRLDRSGRALLRLAGRPWVLVVAIVNVMVLVAALTFLLAPDTAPNLPYVPVAGVEEVEEPVLDHDRDILFVPVDDGFHAFDASGSAPRYCERSDRLESEDGRVWSLRGEPLDGGSPLREYPLIVHDGTIYLDHSTTEPAPTAPDQGAEPVC